MDNNNMNLILLQLIKDANMPVGAVYLSKKLSVPQASIGRILLKLDKEGLIEKVGNKGRMLTSDGLQYFLLQQHLEEKLQTAKSIIETTESSSKQKLFEVLEVRMALESLTAEQACHYTTPKDILELDRILLDQHYDLYHGGIGSTQDLQLHLKIAQMSKNKTLFQMLTLVLTQENVHTKFSEVAPHITSTQINQHKEIIEAIKQKNSECAKQTMISHLKQVILDVKKYYKG